MLNGLSGNLLTQNNGFTRGHFELSELEKTVHSIIRFSFISYISSSSGTVFVFRFLQDNIFPGINSWWFQEQLKIQEQIFSIISVHFDIHINDSLSAGTL